MKHAAISGLVLEDRLFPRQVRIEAVIRPGIPLFRIAGLKRASRDREDRIKTALLASGLALPYTTVLIHVSPAGVAPESALLDLPIAVCLLEAMGAFTPPRKTLFLGELSLTGEILPSSEAMAWALSAASLGFERVVLDESAALSLPPCGLTVQTAGSLRDLVHDRSTECQAMPLPPPARPDVSEPPPLPWQVLRALVLSAAGRHPLLLVGPPGTGKSTAARFLHSLLPPPDQAEWAEMVRHSLFFQTHCAERPLREPHHSLTVAGMVGGGNPLFPGEVSRATHGLLLLDELSQYDLAVIQALREPIERQLVIHNRGGRPGILPASFWFAATSNPCPCGFFGSRRRKCCCSRSSLDRARSILAGPLRDRLDIELFVDAPQSPMAVGMLQPDPAEMLEGIARAVRMQEQRYGRRKYNGQLNGPETECYCSFEDVGAQELWADVHRTTDSHRQEGGVRRLARTIADMDESPCIRVKDIVEALNFRFQHVFWDSLLPGGKEKPEWRADLFHKKVR